MKNHFEDRVERDVLLENRYVRVLNIKRDLRDVVVSAYYHFRRKEGYQEPLERYYWNRGRYVAERVRGHHDLWNGSHARVCVASFKELKENFSKECKRIGAFLDYDLSEAQIQNIKDETSLESLRKAYDNDSFFAKGSEGTGRII